MSNIETAKKISSKCKELEDILLQKNELYGDSSLKPMMVFSGSSIRKIEARMEDKISRLKHLDLVEHPVEYVDSVKDLTGYLILYQIAIDEFIQDATKVE